MDFGYAKSLEFYDKDLAYQLKHNIAQFSEFKETSFRNELLNTLTNKGSILPWSEFKKKAQEISGLYNVNWLQTEYNQTVATANMAGKWQNFQRNKDLYPNLRYSTAGDSRVRDKHKHWDGFIAPIDHPIWKKLYPPNDWGCRCTVVQTDEEISADVPDIKVKKEFKNNAAISGKIFNAPTYVNGITGIDLKYATIKTFQYLLKNSKGDFKRHLEQLVLKLPRKNQFIEVFTEGEGKVLQHLLVKETAEDFKEIFETAKAFAKNGQVAEMMPELADKSYMTFRAKVYIDYDLLKNPDLRVDGVYMDVKRPTAIKNIHGNANNAHKQGAIAIIHTGKFKITEKQMSNRSNGLFDKKNINKKEEHSYPYSEVYFIVEGKLLKYNKR